MSWLPRPVTASEPILRGLGTGEPYLHLTDGSRSVGHTINMYTGMGHVRARVVSWFFQRSPGYESPSAPQQEGGGLSRLGSWVSVFTISTFDVQGVLLRGWRQPHTSMEAIFPNVSGGLGKLERPFRVAEFSGVVARLEQSFRQVRSVNLSSIEYTSGH